MIIKIFDEEYKETEYIRIDKMDTNIQEKADFFFNESNFIDDNTFEDLTIDGIKKKYNEMFSENISREQVEDAIAITENGSYGQTIERYVAIFNAIGYKANYINEYHDLEIVIKEL